MKLRKAKLAIADAVSLALLCDIPILGLIFKFGPKDVILLLTVTQAVGAAVLVAWINYQWVELMGDIDGTELKRMGHNESSACGTHSQS